MLQIISGKHKKRKLASPKSALVRPTTSQLREAVFNICQHQIEAAYFLDLFAGSGAIGLEALSRGAMHATFVERERPSLCAIRRNIAALGEGAHATVIPGDVLTIVPLLQGPFDIIYADPPYGKGLGARILGALDAHPVLVENGVLFIEDASLDAPPLKRLQLKQKRRVGCATLFEYCSVPFFQ